MQIIINKIIDLKKLFFFSRNFNKYCAFNKKKWQYENKLKKNNGVILVDLFHHYPFINIWAHIVNILIKKKKI